MEIPAGLLSVTPEMRTAAELNGGRPQHAISGIVHDQQIPIEIECGPLAEERRWQNALGIKRGPWSEARGIGNHPAEWGRLTIGPQVGQPAPQAALDQGNCSGVLTIPALTGFISI